MRDGLAPGQVRRGLRLLARVLDAMEGFCGLIGKEIYLIEPLFYHSAILYERRGCGYLMGREIMEVITPASPTAARSRALDALSASARPGPPGPCAAGAGRSTTAWPASGRGAWAGSRCTRRPVARGDEHVPRRAILSGPPGYLPGEAPKPMHAQSPQADAGQAPEGRDPQDGVPAPAQAPGARGDRWMRSRAGRHRPLPRDQPEAGQPAALPPSAPPEPAARGRDLGPVDLVQLSGRIMLDLSRHPEPGRLPERLARVAGVANFALAIRTGVSREALRAAVEQAIAGRAFGSFRITARRAFKTFPMTSVEINRDLGAHVLARRPRAGEPRASGAERPGRGAARRGLRLL